MSSGGKKRTGNRKPSPRLYNITRKWTADEWRMIVAYSEVFGKGSQKVRLLQLLRNMEQGYDVESEKKAFKNQNLGSLRYDARHYSYNTVRRLDLVEGNELAVFYGNAEVAIQKENFEDGFEFLTLGKAFAVEIDEYLWFQKFLDQERDLIPKVFGGKERSKRLQELASLSVTNLRNLSIQAEIRRVRAFEVEPARNAFVETGKVNESVVKAYFDSDFYKSFSSDKDNILQIEKLRVDQLAYYLLGEYQSAVKASENIALIFEARQQLLDRHSIAYSNELMNLVAYYSALGKGDDAKGIVARFEKQKKESRFFNQIYLVNYLWSIFQIAFDEGNFDAGLNGLEIWNSNRQFLISQPIKGNLKTLLLYVAYYQISLNEIAEARAQFNLLFQDSDTFDRPQLVAEYMALHLIILFEEHDERGLESFGRNYKRKLKRLSYDLEPIIEIITVLQRQRNISALLENGIVSELTALKLKLSLWRKEARYAKSMIFDLVIMWLDRRLQA